MVDRPEVSRKQVLIFTDLDGTLLDEQTYDFEPALPALRLIKSLGIPLIFASSKTRAEIEFFRERLSLDSPFIVENGGCVFFPPTSELGQGHAFERIDGYSAILIGRPIMEAHERIPRLKERFCFKGFSEMSPQEIASVTGLKVDQAILASRREFDEPVVLESPCTDRETFCKEASELGLDCVSGGRFVHLSLGGDKGRAVEIVLDVYRQLRGPLFSIGLGDSPNDITMLKMVDKAVLMQDKDSGHMDGLIHGDVIKADGRGPRAWSKVILSILVDFL